MIKQHVNLLNITHIKHDGNGDRLVMTVTNISSRDDVKRWVASFSDCTVTDWNVRYSRPNKGHFYYICRFSSFGKKAGREVHHASADRKCTAKLNVRIKSTVAIVNVDHQHTHWQTAQNLGLRKLAPEVCYVQ